MAVKPETNYNFYLAKCFHYMFLQPKIQLYVYGICIGIFATRQRGRVAYVWIVNEGVAGDIEDELIDQNLIVLLFICTPTQNATWDPRSHDTGMEFCRQKIITVSTVHTIPADYIPLWQYAAQIS